MRLLIAVKSCLRDKNNGSHQAIRDTWAKYLPPDVDLRFFVGGERTTLEPDEVYVSAPDDYWSLPLKTREIARYAVKNQYDFTFLCDTDTYVWPAKLLKCGFEEHDYCGGWQLPCHDWVLGKDYHDFIDDKGNVVDPIYVWMSGGVGYFLSYKAAKAVSNNRIQHWAEDIQTGLVLGPLIGEGKLKAKLLPKFDGVAAQHLGCGEYVKWRKLNPLPGEETRKMHLLLKHFQG